MEEEQNAPAEDTAAEENTTEESTDDSSSCSPIGRTPSRVLREPDSVIFMTLTRSLTNIKRSVLCAPMV